MRNCELNSSTLDFACFSPKLARSFLSARIFCLSSARVIRALRPRLPLCFSFVMARPFVISCRTTRSKWGFAPRPAYDTTAEIPATSASVKAVPMNLSRYPQVVACVLFMLLAASCSKKKEAPVVEKSRDLGVAERTRLQRLTIRQIMQGTGMVGTAPSNPRFSADGWSVYLELNNPAALDSLNDMDAENAYDHYLDTEKNAGTYRLDVASKQITKLTDAEADTTAPSEFAWDHARRRRAEIRGGDLFLVDLEPARTRRITQTRDAESSPQVSPDGANVYFRRGNDIYAVGWNGGLLRQVTNLKLDDDPDDKPDPTPQRKFILDQQKQLFVEFKDRGNKKDDEAHPRAVYLGAGMQIDNALVSPSGRFAVVGLSKPASGGRAPIIPMIVTESGYTETEEVRTYVGDVQDASSTVFVDLQADSLIEIDAGENLSVAVMSWSPVDDVALLRGLTNDSHDRLFMTASPSERAQSGHVSTRVVDRWHDPAWVDGPMFDETGAWMPD